MIRLCASEIDNDASIALFDDDRLLSAISEERLSRRKLHAGFPHRAIDEALRRAGLTVADVDELCIAKPPMWKEMRVIHAPLLDYSPMSRESSVAAECLDVAALYVYKPLRTGANLLDLNRQIEAWRSRHSFPRERVKRAYDHHFLHVASAYYGSGFEDALAITADGQGAGVTATIYACRRGTFTRLREVRWPHSMGSFYASATKALGFRPNRHEGKITGLASYEPAAAECLAFCRSIARSSGEAFTVNGVYGRYPELVRLTKKYTPAQVAAAFQTVLEEVIGSFARHWVEKTGLTRVVMAGGVFANVKLNQRIKDIPGVADIFVFPAMADSGLSWGLGMFEARRGREFEPRPIHDVYWGPAYSDEQIERALKEANLPYRRLTDVSAAVGDLLAEGQIVWRFDGAMEFGPRALGNRSILYQGSDKTVNDWLNKILKRTEFMPFAPVTLAEEAHRCYLGLEAGRRAAKYMTVTFQCTPEMAAWSPAAVHVDGTARPQLIDRATNATYYDIVKRHYERTGVPSIINTSYNMHEEPIVCSPEDGIRAYLAGKVGVLSMGPYLVTLYDTPKPSGATASSVAISTQSSGTDAELLRIRELAVRMHDVRAGLLEYEYGQLKQKGHASSAFTYGRKKVDDLLVDVLKKLKPGAAVLDVGCGTGEQLKACRELGLFAVGIEPSTEMQARALKRNPDAAIISGSVTDLPLEGNRFDLVIALEVLRYLHKNDIIRAYREIARVLKPGGRCVFTMVNRYALDGFWIYHRLKQIACLFTGREVDHCEFVTPGEVERELKSAGLEDVKVLGRMLGSLRIPYKLNNRLGSRIAATAGPFDDWMSSKPWTIPFAGHLIVVVTKPQ